MTPATIITLVSADDAFAAAATAALGGMPLRRVRGWRDLAALTDADAGVLVFDGAATAPDDFERLAARARPGGAQRVKAVCMAPDDAAAIDLLTRRDFIDCVTSRTQGFQPGELAPLVTSLSAGRAPEVETQLAGGTPVQAELLRSYDEKDACFERLQSFAATLPGFSDFPQIVVSVVWEMLMNALIDAPSQAGAVSGTGGKDGKGAGVELRYGSDRRHLAVSVQDHYGTLDRAKVVANLARSQRQGPDQIRPLTATPGAGAGAGVGLYLMFSHATQLHFAVRPGVSTKVVLVTRVSKRYGSFTESGRAFNFMSLPP